MSDGEQPILIRRITDETFERDCDWQYSLWCFDRHQYEMGTPEGKLRGTEDQLVQALAERWGRTELEVIEAIIESRAI